MIRIALTHDIDRTKKTYQFFTKPLIALKKGNVNHFFKTMSTFFKTKNYWNFEDIAKIEAGYKVRSTFFFLNESIRFDPWKLKTFQLAHGRYNILNKEIIETIRWLDQNDWEIGVHGSFNSYADKALLENEKIVLEEIVGHEIIGIRQHYLNLDNNTWKIQHEIGFKYDSSFGFTRDIGFKAQKYSPFHPLQNEFVVIPQVIMDTPYMNKSDRKNQLMDLMGISQEKGAVLVVNFHNDKFNIDDYPGYREAYIEIIEAGLKMGAVFKTLGQFYHDFSTCEKS